MKKQSYIYYLFWGLLLIQVFLTIMIWWSQGLVLPLVIFPGMSFFFLIYPRYLLHYNLNQSPTDHGFPDFLLLTESVCSYKSLIPLLRVSSGT